MVAWLFFFQAEDGIRNRDVTGVQTCALPIFCTAFRTHGGHRMKSPSIAVAVLLATGFTVLGCSSSPSRSEERRVGKECKSQGERSNIRSKKSLKVYEGLVIWML